MKVAVGLSGGIDSAATAFQLLHEGHDVIGITMYVFEHQHHELKAAAYAAERLQIPHHIVDLRHAFDKQVIQPFIQSYELGQTPNPCLLCNRTIKFGTLIESAQKLGAERFATGHYVRHHIDPETGTVHLYRARNARKDQSYNLYHLTQQTLKHLYFPLGNVESKEALRASVSHILPALSSKRDSLGICFIPSKSHTDFLTERGSCATISGDFLTRDGLHIGRHTGTAHFTIGQKRGVPKGYVVIGLQPEKQIVFLGTEEDLMYKAVTVQHFHCIDPAMALQLQNEPLSVIVRTSQWSAPYPGSLSLSASGSASVTFETVARAPAPGQALVCYVDDLLIGGGTIE